jgi:AcrR family transcriptional regulator
MVKQSRSGPVMQAVLDAVVERLMTGDEALIRIPEICEATGINYGSVYHHFGSREGVIDAAYLAIYTRLINEDIDSLRMINESATSREEFIDAIRPVLKRFSPGHDEAAKQEIRVRILAAAITRPELRVSIGLAQTRLADELMRVIEFGQDREWLRSDVSAHYIGLCLRAIMFGRTVVYVSFPPIDDHEWERMMNVIFSQMLSPLESLGPRV